MSQVTEMVINSMSAKHDPEKKAVSRYLNADAQIMEQSVKEAKLATVLTVNAELVKLTVDKALADPDVIKALKDLLKD